MKISRREFTFIIGASGAVPTAWSEAASGTEESADLSLEAVLALLDERGSRGIYDSPERLEELRAAVARSNRLRAQLRSFTLPADIEPIISFRRG